MSDDELGPRWRVRRTGGVLWPGFTKRFADGRGMTYLWGVPIGRFEVADAGDGTTELRYLRWPIVDVLASRPGSRSGPIDSSGFIRLPGSRRIRFCDFELRRD